jgi:hypothetical protein
MANGGPQGAGRIAARMSPAPEAGTDPPQSPRRGVLMVGSKATVGSGEQDKIAEGIGTSLITSVGMVVLCPSLRSHQRAETQ